MENMSSGQLLWNTISGIEDAEIIDDKLWEAVQQFFSGPNCPRSLEMRDRYVKALQLRFGRDGTQLNYRSIGEILEDENGHIGITTERVRQIINRALVVLHQYGLNEISQSCFK